MIDLQSEQLLTLAEAARHLPTRPHVSTVWRWAATGGLETVRLGGRVYTSAEALDRFAEHRGGKRNPPQSELTPQRQREIADAERKLRESGL
ncbi:MAG: helix-turn-helix domain-containing protein [Planctomycetes bacterium]|nr:helix-turn-helix domain-containing protein [Planctomycetota bacterium]